MFGKYFDNVRAKRPLIHCITNFVTANDVANALLATGASPIMSDEIGEIDEITNLADGLLLNIGTLRKGTIDTMFRAARRAVKLRHPVVLDPVGAGATEFRTRTSLELTRDIKLSAIRGNISEIRTLAVGSGTTRGVDADHEDRITQETLDAAVDFTRFYARKTDAVIIATGAIDVITDGKSCYTVYNGRPEMTRVTGVGCELSAILTAFLAANAGEPLKAAVSAVIAMGVAGEIAAEKMRPGEGNATYRMRLIDALCNIDGKILDEREKYEAK